MCAVKALVCPAGGYIWSLVLPSNSKASILIQYFLPNHAAWTKQACPQCWWYIFICFCLFAFSPFQRSCRMDQGSAMWWLSDLEAPRAGCRQPCRPQRHPDMFLKTRASNLSRLSTWGSGFTTTRARGHLARLPLSTQLRKVCKGTLLLKPKKTQANADSKENS